MVHRDLLIRQVEVIMAENAVFGKAKISGHVQMIPIAIYLDNIPSMKDGGIVIELTDD